MAKRATIRRKDYNTDVLHRVAASDDPAAAARELTNGFLDDSIDDTTQRQYRSLITWMHETWRTTNESITERGRDPLPWDHNVFALLLKMAQESKKGVASNTTPDTMRAALLHFQRRGEYLGENKDMWATPIQRFGGTRS